MNAKLTDFLHIQQFTTVIMYHSSSTTDARNFVLQHGRRPATFATTVRQARQRHCFTSAHMFTSRCLNSSRSRNELAVNAFLYIIVPRFHNPLGLDQESWVARSRVLWSRASSVCLLSNCSISRARCAGTPSCHKVNQPLDIWSLTAGFKNKQIFLQIFDWVIAKIYVVVFMTAVDAVLVELDFWKPLFHKIV